MGSDKNSSKARMWLCLMDPKKNDLFKLLIALLFVKALFIGLVIISGYIPLTADEAQYWTWSQALDWGYYSKPPGIAWQQALTTTFAGSSEWGVRLGALLIGFFVPVAIYKLAKSADLNDKVAFWAAMIAAFSPFGFFLSFAATTDGGALFFFVLALNYLTQVVMRKRPLNPLLLGTLVGLGALYKWPIYFLWIALFLAMPFFGPLRTKKIALACLVSFFALLPSLYWNFSHDFASFRHVGHTVIEKSSSPNFFSFIFAQMALITPIFFALFIFSFFFILKNRSTISSALLFITFIAAMWVIYMGCALFKRMQPNWALLFIPPAIVVGALWADKRIKLYGFGVALAALGTTVALCIPWWQANDFSPKLPYKLNPLRQSMGNNKIGQYLLQIGYEPASDFLIADKYQVASLLSFYGPKQQRAHFLNLKGSRNNQFSYWGSLGEQQGKNGYFCVIENVVQSALENYQSYYIEQLAPYFDAVIYKGACCLFETKKEGVRYALFFQGIHYNGKLPNVTSLY